MQRTTGNQCTQFPRNEYIMQHHRHTEENEKSHFVCSLRLSYVQQQQQQQDKVIQTDAREIRSDKTTRHVLPKSREVRTVCVQLQHFSGMLILNIMPHGSHDTVSCRSGENGPPRLRDLHCHGADLRLRRTAALHSPLHTTHIPLTHGGFGNHIGIWHKLLLLLLCTDYRSTPKSIAATALRLHFTLRPEDVYMSTKCFCVSPRSLAFRRRRKRRRSSQTTFVCVCMRIPSSVIILSPLWLSPPNKLIRDSSSSDDVIHSSARARKASERSSSGSRSHVTQREMIKGKGGERG